MALFPVRDGFGCGPVAKIILEAIKEPKFVESRAKSVALQWFSDQSLSLTTNYKLKITIYSVTYIAYEKGSIRGTVVARWTTCQQVERLILR